MMAEVGHSISPPPEGMRMEDALSAGWNGVVSMTWNKKMLMTNKEKKEMMKKYKKRWNVKNATQRRWGGNRAVVSTNGKT